MTGSQLGRGACVLTLHRVVERAERAHDVRRESFGVLLDALADRGPFSVELARPEPESVVVTFDDATGDHLEVARELAARRIPAVFFVTFGMLGREGHLDDAALRELVALGHVVGSHALDHAPLAGLSREELRVQVLDSKARLEAVVEEPVRFFAPPGGISHPALAAELERAAYAASRSLRWGLYRASAERWQVPSLPVTEYTVESGWILHAALRGSLPVSMRAAAAVRAVMPQSVRNRVRRRTLVRS